MRCVTLALRSLQRSRMFKWNRSQNASFACVFSLVLLILEEYVLFKYYILTTAEEQTVTAVRVNWIITAHVNRTCVDFHSPCGRLIIAARCLITWARCHAALTGWTSFIQKQHQSSGSCHFRICTLYIFIYTSVRSPAAFKFSVK